MSEMKVGSTEWRLNNLRGQVAMGFPCAPDSDSSALLQLGDERDTLRAELQQALARNTDLSAEVERWKDVASRFQLLSERMQSEREAALAQVEHYRKEYMEQLPRTGAALATIDAVREYAADNTRRNKWGRTCRACQKEYSTRRRELRREVA